MHGHLAHKWGLADLLGENHPYKHAAPLSTLLGGIGNNATTQAGGAVALVSIHNHTTKELVATATPATNGDWTASVPPGTYDISYWADGCRPVTHGPYTVTAE